MTMPVKEDLVQAIHARLVQLLRDHRAVGREIRGLQREARPYLIFGGEPEPAHVGSHSKNSFSLQHILNLRQLP